MTPRERMARRCINRPACHLPHASLTHASPFLHHPSCLGTSTTWTRSLYLAARFLFSLAERTRLTVLLADCSGAASVLKFTLARPVSHLANCKPVVEARVGLLVGKLLLSSSGVHLDCARLLNY